MIDDSETVCTRVLEILRSVHCLAEAYRDSKQGLQRIARSKPDCLLLELVFPQEKDANGFALCRKLALQYRHELPIVILSSKNTPLDIRYAREQGARGYIDKNQFSAAKLITTLVAVLPDTFFDWSTSAKAALAQQRSVPPPALIQDSTHLHMLGESAASTRVASLEIDAKVALLLEVALSSFPCTEHLFVCPALALLESHAFLLLTLTRFICAIYCPLFSWIGHF